MWPSSLNSLELTCSIERLSSLWRNRYKNPNLKANSPKKDSKPSLKRRKSSVNWAVY